MTAITCSDFCTRKPGWFTHLREIRKTNCIFQIKMCLFFQRKKRNSSVTAGWLYSKMFHLRNFRHENTWLHFKSDGRTSCHFQFICWRVIFVLHHLAIKFQHKSLCQKLYLLLKKNVPKSKVSLEKRNKTETTITSPHFDECSNSSSQLKFLELFLLLNPISFITSTEITGTELMKQKPGNPISTYIL